MTLVQLLVGLVVGLFVLMAAAGLAASFAGANHKALLTTRLLQDLRATADVITRDLRRAGYRADAPSGIWAPGRPLTATLGQFSEFTRFNTKGAEALQPAGCSESSDLRPTPTTGGSAICYYIAQSVGATPGSSDSFEFKLEEGVILARYGGGDSTPLTDRKTIEITRFAITPSSQTIDGSSYCRKPCTSNCPVLVVREFEVLVEGNVPGDATIARTLRSDVRVRNDYLGGACPA